MPPEGLVCLAVVLPWLALPEAAVPEDDAAGGGGTMELPERSGAVGGGGGTSPELLGAELGAYGLPLAGPESPTYLFKPALSGVRTLR